MDKSQEDIIRRIGEQAAQIRRRKHEEIPLRPDKQNEGDQKKEEALIRRAKKLGVKHWKVQETLVEGNRAGRMSRN